MLFPIYSAIKAQLAAADTEGAIKGIEWYNVQYENTIATTPRIFVEFPEQLAFALASKNDRRTNVKIRLHVVTQALSGADGTIGDTIAQNHETVANLALNAVEGFLPEQDGSRLTSRLHLSAWQHWHKYKGWMVTFVEFEGLLTV